MKLSDKNTSYDELIAQAEQARHRDDGATALGLYRQALELGGPRQRYCQQMLGVCHNMTNQFDEALEWFEKALDGADDKERGHILRDKGKTLHKLGRYMEAEKHFQESLRLLPIYDDPVPTGATLGFYATLRMDQNKLSDALKQLKVADAILQASSNRQIELYVALWYAYGLIQADQPDKAKRVASRALELAKKYGGQAHIERGQLYLEHADDPKLVKTTIQDNAQAGR